MFSCPPVWWRQQLNITTWLITATSTPRALFRIAQQTHTPWNSGIQHKQPSPVCRLDRVSASSLNTITHCTTVEQHIPRTGDVFGHHDLSESINSLPMSVNRSYRYTPPGMIWLFFCLWFTLLRRLGNRYRYRPLIATFDSLSPLRYYAMSNYDTYTRTGPSWTIFDPSLLLLDCALSSYFWIRVALAVLDREPSWRHCAMSRWANLMSTCSTSSHDPLLLLGTNNYC